MMSKKKTGSRRRGALLLCGSAVLVLPRLALADANASQKAAAESLFDDAVKAMKGGHFIEACPKLEESERIDPGIGTLLYLGECYDKTGRSASAWATFREAASTAQAQGETDRARVAATRADRLQPTLSKLTVRVAPETAQLPSLRVMRDTSTLSSAVFAIALPVDPGRYRVTASADGYQSFETEIEIGAAGDLKAVDIPVLKPAALNAPKSLGGPAVAPASDVSAIGAPKTADTSGASVWRNAAYVTGALGVVGLGIGSYFGVKAISKNSDAKTHCPRGNRCDDALGESLTKDAQHAAVASNIAIGLGAVFVAAGVVLYLSHDPAREAARIELHPLVGRDLAGVGLGGAFQ